MFGGNYAPKGWATCDGQILSISQNTALFSLIGTNFGGNGTTNFALPSLAGRTPLGQGQGPSLSPRTVGEEGGVPLVQLTMDQMANHTHSVMAEVNRPAVNPTPDPNAKISKATGGSPYSSAAPNTQLSPAGVVPVGGSGPHNNMQPYLCVTFIIALVGIFPQRP